MRSSVSMEQACRIAFENGSPLVTKHEDDGDSFNAQINLSCKYLFTAIQTGNFSSLSSHRKMAKLNEIKLFFLKTISNVKLKYFTDHTKCHFHAVLGDFLWDGSDRSSVFGMNKNECYCFSVLLPEF